jgi:hypothetical protein
MSSPALPRLLSAADARTISVVVGLELPHPASDLPSRTGNASFDRALGRSSGAIAAEVHTLYGRHRSLAGFYLPVEFDAGPNPVQWSAGLALPY